MSPENKNQTDGSDLSDHNHNYQSHQAGDVFAPSPDTTPIASSSQLTPQSSASTNSEIASQPPPASSNPFSQQNQTPDDSGTLSTWADSQTSAIPTAVANTDHLQPPPKKSRKRGLIIALVCALIVIIAGVSVLAYNILVVEPKIALASYVKRVAAAKTVGYEANASIRPTEEKKDKPVDSTNAPDLLTDSFSVSVKGSYDLRDEKQPKLEATIGAKSGEVDLIKGSVMSFVDEIFFKIENLSMLSGFGIKIDSQWYKIKVDQALKDVGKDDCKLENGSKGLLNSPIFSALPVKDAKRVSFSEKIAGHNTAHYSGEIDFSKIQTYINDLNAKLPASCKITIKGSDFSGLSVKYDLYTAKNFDRLDLSVTYVPSKTTANLTVDTKNYNQPISIEKPADAKDIKSFMDLLSSAAGETAGSNSPRARDAQRKSDLRNIQGALEIYYSNNVHYPSRNNWTNELTKQPNPSMESIPKDPKTGQDYVYNGTPNTPPFTGYTLSATLEDKNDKDAKGGVYTVTNVQ